MIFGLPGAKHVCTSNARRAAHGSLYVEQTVCLRPAATRRRGASRIRALAKSRTHHQRSGRHSAVGAPILLQAGLASQTLCAPTAAERAGDAPRNARASFDRKASDFTSVTAQRHLTWTLIAKPPETVLKKTGPKATSMVAGKLIDTSFQKWAGIKWLPTWNLRSSPSTRLMVRD